MIYRLGNKVIGIGNLPNGKRKSLYVGNDCCITKVASFSSDEAADKFESYLSYFLGLEPLNKAGDIEESDAEFMCKAMSKTVNKSVADNHFIGGF